MDENEMKALQAQLGEGGSQPGAGGEQEQEAKRAAEAEMKRDLLATVLDGGARERLSRIALVAPQRSAQIEGMLLRMAQTGQLRGRVTEQMLIGLLEQAEDSTAKQGIKKGAIVVSLLWLSRVCFLITPSTNGDGTSTTTTLTSESMQLPDSKEIQAVYDDIFYTGPYLSLAKLREAAAQARLLRIRPSDPDYGHLIPGRSIAWKLFLIPADTSDDTRPDPKHILQCLKEKRGQYSQNYGLEMTAPDGSWMEGYSPTDERPSSPTKGTRAHHSLERNNPLSLDSDNPWKTYFTSLEVLKTVQQDVERTFPDIPFFQLPYVQKELTIVLFLHAQLNKAVGYRQGMHEIAACLYMTLYFDSQAPLEGNSTPKALEEFCSKEYVAADTSYLLSILLSPRSQLGRWFEWRDPSESASSPVISGPTIPYVAPIAQTCNYLQNVLLKSIDPVLHSSLKDNNVEATIYGIRWFRLLFTREFEIRESMLLWDAMFAVDPSLEIAIWVGLTMLIRIRNNLIPASYNGQLTALLRYPRLPSSDCPPEPNHIILLARQASYLRGSPTVASGAAIVYENQNVLGLESRVPEKESSVHFARRSAGNMRSTGPNLNAQALPDFAKGILDRGEQWGVNKTVLNTISGLRRNFPDISQSLQGRLTPPSGPGAMSEFSSASLTPPSEVSRPPWEPRTRFEIEREAAALRDVLKTLSEAVGSALDVLLHTETDPDRKEEDQSQRREALECLDYVREVLGQVSKGEIGSLDEERLWGEELAKRKKIPETQQKVAEALAESEIAELPTTSIAQPSRTVDAPGLSTARKARGTTALPINTPVERQLPNRNATPIVAPWNHTPSNFSSSSYGLSLPTRPPPMTLAPPPAARTSSGRPEILRERSSSVQQDPLGALKK